MANDTFAPIESQDGQPIPVLGIARISTKNQDKMSLDDQEDMHRDFLKEHCQGPFVYEVIATQAKGEWLDREELEQIREAIKTRKCHVVLMEDLGRLLRGLEAVNFCKMAVDAGVRLIAINDGLDTANENWEEIAANASIRHARYVEETSRRIKQRKRARFLREGRALPCEIFGYEKKPNAETENDLLKIPSAQPIYDQIFDRLEAGGTYAEVADWVRETNTPVGKYCRTGWNGTMLARLVHNPILKGLRIRNRMVSRKHQGSGKRRSKRGKPEELCTRQCPHLAFIEPERYDRVLYMLDARNENKRRKRINGQDPFLDRPKKRTTWPGQHIYCSICNRVYRYDGHGRNGFLTCSGINSYNCWNTFSLNGADAGKRIYSDIMLAIESLPDFDPAFRQIVERQLLTSNMEREQKLHDLERQHSALERGEANLLAQLREFGPSHVVHKELQVVGKTKADVHYQLQQLKIANQEPISLPPMATLKSMAIAAISELAPNSREFLRQMQRLIPRIWLYPFRLLDGGRVVLRAQFSLNLSGLFKRGCPPLPDEVESKFQRLITVKLYDDSDREKYRVAAIAAMARLHNQRKVAAELGIAQAVVSKAILLQNKMDALGVADAYALLAGPPADNLKLKVHLHKRYHFLADTSSLVAPPYVTRQQ